MLGYGNIFIADTNNSVVREITIATGIITTVAGTGASGFSGDGGLAERAQLYAPSSVLVDIHGNIFIADGGNQVIREIFSDSNNINTIAGNHIVGYSGDNGIATQAELDGLTDIAFDANGNLYIADSDNNVVREILFGVSP